MTAERPSGLLICVTCGNPLRYLVAFVYLISLYHFRCQNGLLGLLQSVIAFDRGLPGIKHSNGCELPRSVQLALA